MSQKLKYHKNQNNTKTEILKNWNVTPTEMSLKLICHKNWNINKTELLPKLICVLQKSKPNSIKAFAELCDCLEILHNFFILLN